jgi:hypothetical protein
VLLVFAAPSQILSLARRQLALEWLQTQVAEIDAGLVRIVTALSDM